MNNEWLQELKAGDSVIVGGSHGPSRIETVERITKTMIVLGPYSRFRKDGGREIGGDRWYGSSIQQATSDAVDKITHDREKRAAVASMLAVHWESKTLDHLKRILAEVEAKPLDTKKRPVTIPDQGAGQFAVASEAEGGK